MVINNKLGYENNKIGVNKSLKWLRNKYLTIPIVLFLIKLLFTRYKRIVRINKNILISFFLFCANNECYLLICPISKVYMVNGLY